MQRVLLDVCVEPEVILLLWNSSDEQPDECDVDERDEGEKLEGVSQEDQVEGILDSYSLLQFFVIDLSCLLDPFKESFLGDYLLRLIYPILWTPAPLQLHSDLAYDAVKPFGPLVITAVDLEVLNGIAFDLDLFKYILILLLALTDTIAIIKE